MNYYIPQSLVMFQVLRYHLWLVATILDSTDREQVHYLGKYCWTALIYILLTKKLISLYFTVCQIFMGYLCSSTNDTEQTHNTVPHSWRFHLK